MGRLRGGGRVEEGGLIGWWREDGEGGGSLLGLGGFEAGWRDLRTCEAAFFSGDGLTFGGDGSLFLYGCGEAAVVCLRRGIENWMGSWIGRTGFFRIVWPARALHCFRQAWSMTLP